MFRLQGRVALAAAAVALTCAPAASPHNAGHLILPNGSCLEVGSFKEVHIGPDGSLLDLIPATPPDEIGASFAAFQGNTRLLPGPC